MNFAILNKAMTSKGSTIRIVRWSDGEHWVQAIHPSGSREDRIVGLSFLAALVYFKKRVERD